MLRLNDRNWFDVLTFEKYLYFVTALVRIAYKHNMFYADVSVLSCTL